MELAPYESVLAGALLPSLAMAPVPVAEPLAVCSTKLGGVPDLPPGTPWPDGTGGEPLPFVLQLNLTDLAERFDGLLPWPAGGGIVQLFTTGDDRDAAVLVHRDLAALRQATPPVEPAQEYRLDPSVQHVLSDDSLDTAPLWSLAERLGREQPDVKTLLDTWGRRFLGTPLQVGGGGRWIQDAGYWEAWASDHGYGLWDFEYTDQDDYHRKTEARYINAVDQARAEGWQVVFNLCDDKRVVEAFASFGGFFLLAPADAAGRWDLDRLQLQYQCT